MSHLVRILVWDHIRSGRIAVEFVLVVIFVWLMQSVIAAGTAPYASALAFLSIVLVPITVLRLAKRTFLSSHYLIASGPGRTVLLLGVVTGCLIVDVAMVAMAAFAPMVAPIAWDAWDMASRLVLLVPMMLVAISLCVAMSRLVLPRVGSLFAVAILAYLALVDPTNPGILPGRPTVEAIDPYLPPFHATISALGQRSQVESADLLLTLLSFSVGIIVLALVAFRRRELIFDE